MIDNIFDEHIILENERVLLRPIEADDGQHLLEFSMNEPDIWNFGLLTAAGEENLKKYVESALINRREKKEYTFIVFDKLTNSYAGSTRFYDIQQSFSTTQLGYTWYGKRFQRSGLNRHCKMLLLSFCFEQWMLERVEFRAHAGNAASLAAMKNIGCVEEGILRNNMPTVLGTRRDTMVLSIIKSEWFKNVKELIQSKIY